MNGETLLIVDDDPEIVRLLEEYLAREGFRILTATNGRAALQQLRAEQPDCVLLDVMLPDMDGWSVTRTVRASERLAAIPIIMLTARVDDADKIVGLEMGADDYITKPFNPRELLARIRVQLRRALHAPETPLGRYEVGPLTLDVGRHRVTREGDPVELTATEFDILHTFMQHPGYVFTRDELIERALGYTYEGLGRTVDSHIKNLRRKIEPDPREPTLIQTVYGVGYRFADEDG